MFRWGAGVGGGGGGRHILVPFMHSLDFGSAHAKKKAVQSTANGGDLSWHDAQFQMSILRKMNSTHRN